MGVRLSTLYLSFFSTILYVYGHFPEFMTTPANKLDQYCLMSETCIHDTVPVCGKMNEQTRTFLDLCDLIEYVCDHNEIFIHIDDTPECPQVKA